MRKREKVETGIYREYRSDGKAWVFLWRIYHDGATLSETLPAGTSLRDAKAARARKLADLSQGGPVPPARMTLADFLPLWLNDRTPRVSRNTARMYADDVRYWLVALGGVRLRQMSAADVRQGLDDIAARGLAPKTVKNALTTLRSALAWGVRRETISRNVALAVDPPKVPLREHAVLNMEQTNRLLAACEAQADPYAYLVALTVLTGTRGKSELGALTWADMDWTASTVRLHRKRLQDGSVALLPHSGGLKGNTRDIPLTPTGLKFLKLNQAWQLRQRQVFQDKYDQVFNPDDLIFASEYGEYLRQSSVHRAFKRLLETAGIATDGMRFHDLRHSVATTLAGDGVELLQISKLLGHSSVQVTANIYTHGENLLARAAADRFEHLLRETQRDSDRRAAQ